MEGILLIFIAIFIGLVIFRKKSPKKITYRKFPDDLKKILIQKVNFYNHLNPEEKISFEKRILYFLDTTRIIGIKTSIDIVDKLLVASSAIIPVFSFPEWEYINLNEVLLYPSSFNEKFQTGSQDSLIQGMVGSGYMNGKMILSKSALHLGFQNESDKKNVGIHEFVHLIDKADGQIDGIPELLLQKQYTIPWLDLIRNSMKEIHNASSDVNPYGGVNSSEFFSVISEYFFEQPKLLERKHPELYKRLKEIFTTDLSKKYKSSFKIKEIQRNDPCLCGSGIKFKKCCGKF